MFKIAVVGGYAENYVDRCLSSFIGQEEKDWEIQVVLDPVGDKTFEVAKQFLRPNIKIKLNSTRQYGLHNFIDAFKMLNPSDDDILVTMDADDWLASEKSLSIIKHQYQNKKDLLLTHGSWISYPIPNIKPNNWAYTEAEFFRGIRNCPWHASQLRTMKFRLWKNVRDEDLRDDKGEYFRVTWDMAFMFPAMEMAGLKRVQFIPEIIYVYNQETPFNDGKLNLAEQQKWDAYIRALPPYPYQQDI
jgi:glycosyltransferase involved in cell wall biosynthesis